MGIICWILLSISLAANGVWSQCTFPSAFAGQTWLDNTRGTLTFASTTMSGWSLVVFGTTLSQWECVAQTDLQLIIRSTNSATFATATFYAYLCLELTKITDNSYRYYQQHEQQPNAGYERAKFSVDRSLTTAGEICSTNATIPTLEFHVLVKQGNELAAAVTCPVSLLFSADYQYQDTNLVTCNNTDDTWDVCTDTTTMTFNYTTCSQMIAYSGGGVLTCVASVDSCAVVYNQDTTLEAGATQFACICSNGVTASVAPGNCTSDQTPSAIPTVADGVTSVGHLLNYGAKYVSCGSSDSNDSGLSTGVVVAIVVCLLIVTAIAIAVSLFLYMSKRRKRENRVSEGEKPILADEKVARVEHVDETAKASKLNRESSNVSFKGKLQRNTTLGSIGLDLKSNREKSTMSAREKSAVSKINVEPKEDTNQSSTLLGKILPILPCCRGREKDDSDEKKPEPEKEPRLQMCGKDLSFLVCCPEKKEPEEVKDTIVIDDTTKSQFPNKDVKSGNKSPKAKPKGKAKTKGKKSSESQTDSKPKSAEAKGGDESKQTSAPKTGRKKKGQTESASPVSPRRTVVASPSPKPTSPKPNGKRKSWNILAHCNGNKSPPADEHVDDAIEDEVGPRQTSTPKPDKMAKGKSEVESPSLKPKVDSSPILKSTSPKLKKKTKGKSEPESPLAPRKVISSPILKSTSPTSDDKAKDWTFLACCYGKRSPPPPEEPETVVEETSPAITKGKGTKGKGDAKGNAKGKPVKKAVAKKGGGKGKKNTSKSTENVANGQTNDLKIEDLEEIPNGIERAKTMPEKLREKTALSLKDAEKVKVDVYIPDDKSRLQLKDTVTVVKETNGIHIGEKSKSALGLTRGDSASAKDRPKSNTKKSAAKSDDKKVKKGGGKEKKQKKKKK